MSSRVGRENKKTRALAEDVKRLKKQQKKYFYRWLLCMAAIVAVLIAIWIFYATSTEGIIRIEFVIAYFVIMIVVLLVASFQWNKYSRAKDSVKELMAKIEARQR